MKKLEAIQIEKVAQALVATHPYRQVRERASKLQLKQKLKKTQNWSYLETYKSSQAITSNSKREMKSLKNLKKSRKIRYSI